MGFCFRCRNLSLKKWQGRRAFLCKRLRFALCGLFFLGKSYFWNQPVAMIEIFCMFVRPNAWTMDVAAIFQFLEELSRHNDREWFNAHKERYKHAQADFDLLLTGVIARIATFDESVRGIQAKDCTYRIYRDTRFSPDKTPYKTHFGGYINAKGKKSDHCGYYVHVENGNCMLAGGGYCLEPKVLKAVRQSVYDNIDEYREIVEDPQFKQYFPVIGETFLKTAPKGFPKDFPYMDYLKCKDYSCAYYVPDEFFLAPDFFDKTEAVFRQLKRFADFMNYTIDDIIE